MHGIKTYIMKELKEHEASIDSRGGMSSAALDRIHTLTDTYKNICKIEKLDGCMPVHHDHEEKEYIHEEKDYSDGKVRKMLEKLYREADHESTKSLLKRYMDEF